MTLDWKRARRDETDLSSRRIWETRCKSYQVIESVGKLSGMGTTWYAIKMPMTILTNRAKGKKGAQKVCEDDHKRNLS